VLGILTNPELFTGCGAEGLGTERPITNFKIDLGVDVPGLSANRDFLVLLIEPLQIAQLKDCLCSHEIREFPPPVTDQQEAREIILKALAMDNLAQGEAGNARPSIAARTSVALSLAPVLSGFSTQAGIHYKIDLSEKAPGLDPGYVVVLCLGPYTVEPG
jgi:hypothetical protein